MTKQEEQMRAEFEAWYVPEDDRYREQCLQRNKDGNYLLKGVYDAWEAWKACQRQNDAEIVRLQEELEEAKQPIQVTDEMVEAGAKALAANYYDTEYPLKTSPSSRLLSKKTYVEHSWNLFSPQAKAALQAALNVKVGE